MNGTGRRGGARVVLGVLTVGIWVGLVRLGWAFLDGDLQWRYVAEQTRLDAPWYYRLAGVWGGMDGSLLLLAGVLGVAGLLATRRVSAGVAWAATATLGAVTVVGLAWASPFDRLAAPAVTGFGLTPILEHPAMTIHPPVLYAGLAAAGGAAVRAAGGEAGPWRSARRWHLATLALLAAAMTSGAAWSYLEQGWGGYWAWDPVENTSLMVWLAALVALHAGPVGGPRLRVATGVTPWCLALVGAVLVRSGVTPSIHGFAERPAIGWALLALAVVTVAAATRRVVGEPPGVRRFVPTSAVLAPVEVLAPATVAPPGAAAPAAPASDTSTGRARAEPAITVPERRGLPADPRLVTVVLATAALVVVVAGTVVPVLDDVLGGRRSAVRGELYSRTIGPLALVAVPFLALRLRDWRRSPWTTAAHAGALVLLVGIAASTFDRSETVPIPAGATVEAAGLELRNDGVAVVDGPRPGTQAVVATLRAGARVYEPRIVVHPERGGRLAEVAARSGPLTDVLVVLESASDEGAAVVTVHVRRLMWLVWLGAAVVSVATLGLASSRRRR